MNFTAEIQTPAGSMFDSFAAGDINFQPTGYSPGFGRHNLGQRAFSRDGRVFRFVRMGAVAAVPGTLYQSLAPVANHLALTPTAGSSIGATQVTATLGATAAAANLYAQGWLQVDTAPGPGIMYGVNNHLAVLSAGIITVNLNPDDPIQVALTTTSRVGLISNPYADVIQVPTARTGIVVGVPLVAIPIGYYGWVQTWGPCCLLINGTPAVTAPVINGGTTAGSADVWTAAAQPTTQKVGDMMQVGVSTKYNAVYLTIAP